MHIGEARQEIAKVNFRFIENFTLSVLSIFKENSIKTQKSELSIYCTQYAFMYCQKQLYQSSSIFLRVYRFFYCSHIFNRARIYFNGLFYYFSLLLSLSFTFVLLPLCFKCRQPYSLPYQMCIFLVVLLSRCFCIYMYVLFHSRAT